MNHKVSHSITRHHKVSHCITGYHTVSQWITQGITQYHKISLGFTQYHTVSQWITRYHTVSQGITRYHTHLMRDLTVDKKYPCIHPTRMGYTLKICVGLFGMLSNTGTLFTIKLLRFCQAHLRPDLTWMKIRYPYLRPVTLNVICEGLMLVLLFILMIKSFFLKKFTVKPYHVYDQKSTNWYHISDPNGWKTVRFGAIYLYSSYLQEYFFVLYLAIIEWGWVGYEEFCRSRGVLSTEAEGRGG